MGESVGLDNTTLSNGCRDSDSAQTSKQLRYFCFDRETSLASIGCRIHHQDNHQEIVSETIFRMQACQKTGFHKRDRTVVLAQTMAVSAATSIESDRKTYPPKFCFRKCDKLDETQAQPFRNVDVSVAGVVYGGGGMLVSISNTLGHFTPPETSGTISLSRVIVFIYCIGYAVLRRYSML